MPNWRVPIAHAAAAEPSSRSRTLRDSKPRLYSQRAISIQPVNWMSDMKVKESINTSGLARNPRVRTVAGHAGSDPRRSKPYRAARPAASSSSVDTRSRLSE
jgi:hypothetical protein